MIDKVKEKLFKLLIDRGYHQDDDYTQEERDDRVHNLVKEIANIVDENSPIRQIKEFMTTFNQPIRESPQMPTVTECLFRLNLIKEETIEIAMACGSEVYSGFGRDLFNASQKIHYESERLRENLKPNLVGVLDGLKDLEYVSKGTEITFGMQYVSEKAFQAVHDSNMTKACENMDEALDTLGELQSSNNPDVWPARAIESKNGKVLVLRSRDGKVLKSMNYTSVNLEPFINPLAKI